MLSVEKQIPTLTELHSLYEKIPVKGFLETDVDSYFHPSFSDISDSQRRIARVSKGSNKKSFPTTLFQFSELKRQQRYDLQKDVKISKREISSSGRELARFSQNI